MALKRTTIIASSCGTLSLILFTITINLRSVDRLITNSLFEMFSSSNAFQLPPYNGTMVDERQFFLHLHTQSLKCEKLYKVSGKSCKKHSDAEKEICLEDHYLPTANNCVVYSFGMENELFFEDELFMAFECETHLFDPSMAYAAGVTKIAEKETHHPVGLGNGVIDEKGIKKDLKELSRKFSTVDIIKIDLWGQEWKVLEILLDMGILDGTRQLTFSVHLDFLKRMELSHWKPALQELLELLLKMELTGLRRALYQESRNTLTSVLLPTEDLPRAACGRFLYLRK